ncbi:MAG TPA: xanthine dehydrogenase family protein molybdopterin-binding subunit [Stellaceae bacterium]|nr:xanthine dehydrogenase family protein molybdopterin-binding subunit [Stellaceae bacterium]
MDTRVDENALALEQFGVGQPVLRVEDPKLLRGRGRYTDDVNVAGQAHAYVVRSRYAHGTIRKIDVAAARKLPGVLGAYTAADLAAAGVGPIKCGMMVQGRDGKPWLTPPRPVLAAEKVRFAGEAVALIVAETLAQAKDAAEAVEVEIDPLPAVPTPVAALAAGAPQVHDSVPGNIAVDYHWGDSAKVAEAFAKAAHVTKLSLVSNRIVINPLEPRSALGQYDAASGKYTLTVCSQGVFGMKGGTAGILGTTPDKMRILTHNVGGSFGMKSQVFPENVMVLFAAKALGRPVKWTDERSDSFLSDHHGRDHAQTIEGAFDKDGNILAVRLTGTGNAGAYPIVPLPYTVNAVKNVVGVYKTPLLEVNTKGVYTNSTPVGAYRGAGRPEGNYYMERLLDTAAAEMGIDKLELRRRNHIPASAIPYKAPSDMNYDSGDFRAVMDHALRSSDWQGFEQRKAESRARGKIRGRGIGSYLEVTAPQGKEMGGIRFDKDGGVTIVTGTLDYGQGHHAPFAQVLVSRLGIPFHKIRLLQGDSDELLFGGGTGGSRSIMSSGNALVKASDQVIERGKQIAAVVLEAAPADIEFGKGRFTIVGTDRSVGLMELAAKLRDGLKLPEGTPDSLDVNLVADTPSSAFPNGCHIAEVELDPDTGVIEVVKYSMVNDFGNIVNPLTVAGQAHGGVVQGIGQALLERTYYDADGQLLSGSYMDYAMPRADNAPMFAIENHPVPAATNVLGVKGCGEAGCAGSLPSIMNAVLDALSEYGIKHIDMPATPERIWRAIREARPA